MPNSNGDNRPLIAPAHGDALPGKIFIIGHICQQKQPRANPLARDPVQRRPVCVRIQSPITFSAAGEKVSSIFPYSAGDPVSAV